MKHENLFNKLAGQEMSYYRIRSKLMHFMERGMYTRLNASLLAPMYRRVESQLHNSIIDASHSQLKNFKQL